MSARACITALRSSGKLDDERARRFTDELDRLEFGYRKSFSDVEAAEMASSELLDRLTTEAAITRRQKTLQIAKQRSILLGLIDHVQSGGRAGRYAIALLDHHEAVPGVSNISNRHVAMKQLAWSRMGNFLKRFHRDLRGIITHSADLDDFVRERFGESTGNPIAKELADAFGDTAEWLRQQFNVAGGHIGKMDGWGLPQAHDSLSVARAGFEAWRDFIRPLLDPEKMTDGDSGRPFTESMMDQVLQNVWQSISSAGLDKMEPGQMTGSKIANRRSDGRFLVFKDADSWLQYQDRFGTGDAFNAVTGHIDGMAKDIASMQILGPNPGLTIRWLGDILRKGAAPSLEGGKDIQLEKSAAKGARQTERMWRFYRGELSMPEPTDRGTARFFAGLRNWNVASDLGSAFVSAFGTDPIFAGITAKFNGLDATKLLADYATGLASRKAKDEALHAGLVFNEMTTHAEKLWREDTAMRLNVHEFSRRLSSGVLRASLLEDHTVAMKRALGIGFMKDMADMSSKSFAELPRADQLRFQRYGIDRDLWDYIRETPIYDQEEHKLLRPGDIASREDHFNGIAQEAALRILEMIDSETKFGVPGELLRAQTALAIGGRGSFFQRGTIAGEIAHSATQFKTYSVIALMTHFERAIYGNGGINRYSYAVMLPLFLTLGGAAVIQMKNILSGKDAEPMDGRTFWGRAFVQGGGAGMAGDFLATGLLGRSRTGGTIAGYLAGPTVSNVMDPALDLMLGNIGKAGQGKQTSVGHEFNQIWQRNLPGGNLWYLNLASHRLLLDQLNASVDPKYRQSWRAMEQRARQQRTQFWWGPGKTAPNRGPDLSANGR